MITDLPAHITVIVDIIAWFIFHMSIAFVFYKAPSEWFERDNIIFRTRKWEKKGNFWNKYTKVKRWKTYLPDGSAFFKKGFRKKYLTQSNPEFLKMFVTESRRAEMTHYISMLPAPLFFLWNPLWAGCVMIIYAILVNLPCIIVQRYNRPRFQKLIARGDGSCGLFMCDPQEPSPRV